MVKISVLIPVYNAETYLNEAIDSILNQTFKDFELICVNDGSLDNSLEILENYAKNDSRFKIISQENAGCGAARNLALDEASGDYIYFFDPDDYILPNTLEDLYSNAIANNSEIVVFKVARFRYKNEIDYSNPGFPLEKIFKNKNFNDFTFNYKEIKKYVLNSSFAPWTKLYKREFLESYDDFRFDIGIAFDDTPFHVKTILRANKISFVPYLFYYYRFNPNSINNTASNGMDIFKICDLIENFLREENYFCEFIEEFKLFKIHQILTYMLSTDSEEYFQIAKKEFSEIHIGKNHKLNKYKFNRYNLVLKTNTLEEFKIKDYELSIQTLKNKQKKLKRKNKKLKRKNKKLKRELKNVKKFNTSLKESNSWKVTKNFRR